MNSAIMKKIGHLGEELILESQVDLKNDEMENVFINQKLKDLSKLESFLLGSAITLFSCTEGSKEIAENIVENAIFEADATIDPKNETIH